jgi:hypothetical protein
MSTFLTLLTGGGLAAAGGLASGAVTNWLGAMRDKRKYERDQVMAREAHSHEQALALEAGRHEQAMAVEARRQERLEQAYLELLTYLSHFVDWVRSIRPIWGPIPTPDPVPDEERRRIEALVTAYGSPEVLRLLREWGECAAKVDRVNDMLRRRDKSRDPGQDFDDEAHKEDLALPGYKQAMLDADKAIRDQVQRELAGGA